MSYSPFEIVIVSCSIQLFNALRDIYFTLSLFKTPKNSAKSFYIGVVNNNAVSPQDKSITSLATLEDLAEGSKVNFSDDLQGKSDIIGYLNSRIKERKKNIDRANSAMKAIFAGDVLGSTAFGYFLDPVLGAMLGICLAPLAAAPYFVTGGDRIEYESLVQQLEKAQKMSENGYVFACHLKKANLIPSAVADVDHIEVGRSIFYTVKERQLEATTTKLSELSDYVGKPVIVKGNISSAPHAEDMEFKADVDLRFSGIMLFMPFGGTIEGTIGGKIYSPNTHFIVSDSIDMPVTVDYLPQGSKQVIPPYVLKHANPDFGPGATLCTRNELVRFLDNAQRKQRKILIMGRADEFGTLHAEAIGNPETHETFILGVYQPLKA